MSNDKIKLLLEEGLNYSQNDFMDWMELRLERKLSKEEAILVKEHLLKAQILTIFQKDAKFLSLEEIMHKISFLSENRISVPTLLALVKEWELMPQEVASSEEKIKELIQNHLD